MRAPPELCFAVAANVEGWPAILPHYRLVRFHGPHSFGTGRVEMSAWRDFAGPVRYATWWVSDMRVSETEPAIYFEHVDGITRGMHVKWAFHRESARRGGDAASERSRPEAARPDQQAPAEPALTRVRITHEWQGPRWPLVGPAAWRHVIGPHFVSFIANRTLAGVAAEAERRHRH